MAKIGLTEGFTLIPEGKRPSEGWGGAGNTVTTPAVKTAPAASQAAPKTPMDLAALLG